ncbi:helix-turn-helix transcriptional regulator [Williamsia sp.]|uniref:helix-turn-helix domain-containing protein n=1 Tax=Williamsia sp. TaxID=1872085 RepID=UPI001A26C83D|nr:helix-turn-helix transcriptional regulator [Williamsia sp.]MBJ7289909.1 helix-turn-helix domain-containing protein [Williamsia sp.]
MAANGTMLGEYLRAQRDRVRPDQVGLPGGSNRRVRGLRRSEVALLAGISVDYYLRLEQGRDRNPSPEVLEALARVLGLDSISTSYLLSLAERRPTQSDDRPQGWEPVPDGVGKLLHSLNLPAFVENRYFDVLAANSLAASISPRLVVGDNRLRAVFLDRDERNLYSDWEDTTARLVAGFRRSVGADTNTPRCTELVDELSLASERFRTVWAHNDVQALQNWPLVISHPVVGELTLNREKLGIGDTAQSLALAIYHPDPGTDSADKLRLLASRAPVTDS